MIVLSMKIWSFIISIHLVRNGDNSDLKLSIFALLPASRLGFSPISLCIGKLTGPGIGLLLGIVSVE